MLEALFGWRKASKCKDLIRRVRCRLKLLRSKRDAIVRQLKHDVVQLMRNGQHQRAFSRVEQLFKDQSILAAYDLLDQFCEFIINQLPYIRRHRDCPNDINEAVSSLIFAAARCADLPELQILRRLFGERYGHEFAVAAVELYPASLVNRQISEKLSIRSVSDESKLRLIEEISREYSLHLDPPEVEDDRREPHQKVHELPIGNNWEQKIQERDVQVISSRTRVAQTRGSTTEKGARSPGMLSKWKKLIANPCQSLSSTIIKSNSTITVTAAPAKSYSSDPVQPHTKINSESSLLANPMQSKVETASTETLSERSTQFPEKIIVYLDDEDDGLYPSMGEEREGKDEGVFMVKPKNLSQRENCMPSKINRGEDGRSSTGSSSKRKKLGRQSLDKRSTPEQSLYQRENDVDYDELSDFFDTSSSQSRKSHTRESNSSGSMAMSMKFADSARYYEETYDDSDIESPAYSRKTKDSIDKVNSSNHGSHQHSLLNPEIPSVNGMPGGRKQQEEDKLTDGRIYGCKNRRRSNSSCGLSPDLVEGSWAKSPSSKVRRRSMTVVDKREDFCHCRCCSSFEGISVIVSNREDAVQYHNDREDVSTKNPKNSYDRMANKQAINIAEPEFIRVSFPLKKSIDLNQKPDRKPGFHGNCNIATRPPNQGLDGYTRDDVDDDDDDDVDDDDDDVVSPRGSCHPGEVKSGSRARESPMPPPYSRAMTMPHPERPKCSPTNQTRRSASFEQPCCPRGATHIHPKLPDYDDLAAKFTALKNEHRLSAARVIDA